LQDLDVWAADNSARGITTFKRIVSMQSKSQREAGKIGPLLLWFVSIIALPSLWLSSQANTFFIHLITDSWYPEQFHRY